ncbi:protein ndvB [Parachlamydia acanthamoebae UV-7]|uniref:Protein ndvB n=1 Tax=Parachlamydia acanthamoebae (strain UV7) TaxID=765952 RepID=F8KZA2_PARAV|nr:glucoamylase family protein [Parachlamydia acanthamoebae]CCB86235.1 protein ndvB [Parachlamydia acanthamoebae UV-7]
MEQWNIALAFYQNPHTASTVLKSLAREGFRRSAAIHHTKDGKFTIQTFPPIFFYLGIFVLALLFALFLFLTFYTSSLFFINTLIVGVTLGVLVWKKAYLFKGIDKQVLSHFNNCVLKNEILIISQVKPKDISVALSILRHVESGHPLSFLLQPEPKHEQIKTLSCTLEPLSTHSLEDIAAHFAQSIGNVSTLKTHHFPLLIQLKASAQTLRNIRNNLSLIEAAEQPINTSAEWLLDNNHVIQGTIEEIQRNFPKKYYQKLPVLLEGPLKSFPRVYAVAQELICHTGNRLTRENIIAFLTSFQKVQPLSIGELWAVPLMLRLRLIECLHALALNTEKYLRESELASFWGNRLLSVSRNDPSRLNSLLKDLEKEYPQPSLLFSEELLDHLYDEEKIIPTVKKWLQSLYSEPLTELIQQEQIKKTQEDVALSNSIVSLITLSQFSWQSIFETLSPIDAILSRDPLDVYSVMSFNTRDNYRHIIEMLARHSSFSESAIATRILELAENGKEDVTRHVGYYLVDKGRDIIEDEIHYHKPFAQKIRRFLKKHPTGSYLSALGLFTLLVEAGLIYLSQRAGATLTQSSLFALLALIPISEMSIQFINSLFSLILDPFVLPKMSYDIGIPEKYKTLVIVPIKVASSKEIQDHFMHLEVNYLANSDPMLHYGLFVDLADAPERYLPEDDVIMECCLKGMEHLENKYGKGKFFLFSRQRIWSESEHAWIGGERKRGKLEWLNRYLIGDALPENILLTGSREALTNTRYVITLDADTQLPKEKAKQLIETISHPLNVVKLSDTGTILRGYTLIQPRVATNLSHLNETVFSHIFAEATAADPYTQAVSDVYQDLLHEGSYHGKGIYDVQAFHKLLKDRFPDEHVLSHDLLEGAYVRVAFASDIILYDSFPSNYFSWTKRQHRWIRGDWQIIDWLWSWVPDATVQKKKNILSAINRWKILDNLRRSLVPVCIVLLLVCAWLFSVQPGLWTALSTIVLFVPAISLCLCKLKSFLLSFKLTVRELGNALVRCLINLALLPYQAYLSLDAYLRVFYRRHFSHRHLLEWSVNNHAAPSAHRRFLWKLSIFSLLSLIVLVATFWIHPSAFFVALPFGLLWMLSPGIVAILDKSIHFEKGRRLTHSQQTFLRHIARKTWRYFDDFVGPQTHWLPPDNYQAALSVEVAQRTSPTNIGLWMVAVLSAYDLKYLTFDQVLDRLSSTLLNINKLEQYEGHLLNWYDTQTSQPLYPRYVSSVDSGNFLACLWTIEQGVLELLSAPLLPTSLFEGIKDNYELLSLENEAVEVIPFRNLLDKDLSDLSSIRQTIQAALDLLQQMREKQNPAQPESVYWFNQIEKQLTEWDSISKRYFNWVDVLNEPSEEQLVLIHPEAPEWRQNSLKAVPSLQSLASGDFPEELQNFVKILKQNQNLSKEHHEWLKKLHESMQTSQWLAGEKLEVAREILTDLEALSRNMNMGFLYNRERKLFTIGYHVDDCKLDSSYYDLLASEARIASLVSIAKGDIPLEHWWALGRPYGLVDGVRVLLSWGGTMFEYLMPLLFNKYYPHSLLGEGCKAAVACQIHYGKKRGIPWGISESAFSDIDSRKTYQYRSFGVPGLGFKRNLEEDLVVSPYSTGLALSVDPLSAIQNFEIMRNKDFRLLSTYGYYESIDFSRQHGPQGERGVIVYAYMAHHQSMSFIAINNLLNQDIIPDRFHANPYIMGVESLLYENPPVNPMITKKGYRAEIPISRLKPISTKPIMGVTESPHSVTPKVNLLSNNEYSVMFTNSGGGYSRWRDFDLTRWRSDITTDSWGYFCYIKDMDTGAMWSTAFHPTDVPGQSYSVNFKPDVVRIQRRDHNIGTLTEIAISPEDPAEVRLITLANFSSKSRQIELTSYMELVLAPHASDRSHPAFNKLFIQTEALPELSAIIAFRRLRSTDDPPIWMGHLVVCSHLMNDTVQYETDRCRFIGRGKHLQRPEALEGNLSNTVGTVLDPIFSLRARVFLEPSQRVQVSFITVVANTREAVIELIKKYSNLSSTHRAFEMAWTHAQLELRHLRIHQEDTQLFQKLAGRILYPHAQLRPPIDRLRKNILGQSHLWAHGISGDLPIVVISIDDVHEIDLVKQALTAHAFWRLRGLKVDLVILCEEATSYASPLLERLKILIRSQIYHADVDQPGGVFLRASDTFPEDELILLLSVARVNLIAARGSLRQQLVSPAPLPLTVPRLVPNQHVHEEPSRPLPFIELPYFNGLGGFTPDGREYVIYLGPGTVTPMPWINVMANSQFGTLVSETGLGSSWYGNSQTNRLTPWSNDPVLDPIADTLYIRDEQLGTFWTPTPSPIRELDAYRIRHGQGYTRFEHNSHGIEQDLLVFVPVDSDGGHPVRIQRLKLSNHSSHKRFLSVTSFTTWVLGTTREETQMHILTEWDPETQALLAYNHYNNDYGSHVAFASCTPIANSFTANRTEFLGRNHLASDPAALKRKGLSGFCGAAVDPCAALQVMVELAPGEEKELFFFIGYAPNTQSARDLILKCRDQNWIDNTFVKTQNYWDHLLGQVQVETPELFLNFTLNRWLLYQNLSCRIWGRSAFYQSSGAYGFRDQLQDVMALLNTDPQIAKQQILRAAAHQFIEGDVQHWWHPPANGGVRTRITDDLLWLPFVTAQYIRVTKDLSILDEVIPFLKGEILAPDQHEAYFVPEVSEETGTLFEHCRRAILKGITAGPHGLPLIGGGDWNDGMNRVGIYGKGESVWLAWFLIHVLNDFAEILTQIGQESTAESFTTQAERLAETVEAQAWDGNWYRRAYFDDGTPLGSQQNEEDQIDCLPQAWAVISGAGQTERISQAMLAVEEHLVREKERLVLLLTPPFDKTPLDPGYIKGYPPGVRENGGQYTHGSLWVPLAFARMGEADKAAKILRLMHPITHTPTAEDANRYKAEPYVLAGDVYFLENQIGRGGWSWYTGSCGWMYRIWLEEMLGFKLRGDKLTIQPCMPTTWESYKIYYRYKTTHYTIIIENPSHLKYYNLRIEIDGVLSQESEISLVDDGKAHEVKIILIEIK